MTSDLITALITHLTRSGLPCLSACSVLTIGLFVAGCGGPTNKHGRLPISGTVTLDGVPLATGLVVLEPKSGQQTQSGGMIANGKFEVPESAGAAPGSYSVAIYAGAATPSGDFEPGTPEYEAAAQRTRGVQVPRKYNIDTTLSCEVKSGEENKFTFDLSSK